MRVLFVAPFFPLPIRSGGHTRMASLLKWTGERHHLCWISLGESQPGRASTEELNLAAPPELMAARPNLTLREKLNDGLNPANWVRTASRLVGRFQGIPLEVLRMSFPQMSSRIRELTAQVPFDIIQLEYTALGGYLPLIRRCSPQSRIVLDEIDVSYIAMERLHGRDPDSVPAGFPKQIERMKRYERDLWTKCDAVVTMSDLEREHVARYVAGERVWSVPNGVDPGYFAFGQAPETASSILFVGNLDHPPNRIGLTFFLDSVWPDLCRLVPRLTLDVVGDGGTPELLSHQRQERVRFHGYVPDIRPLMGAAALMIVPILNGSGTRLKILEAFSAGVPVVSTALGCEGLEVVAGHHFLGAETAQDFVGSVQRLLRERELGLRLAEKGRALVEQRYSWEQIGRAMESVWEYSLR
ncbi:MAG: glycosyltransferase family 4 protein [Acidobacteriota bacterium]|nr:MAG: glycosyltransferase family 4 protein [Acidobacteriota bacterium]